MDIFKTFWPRGLVWAAKKGLGVASIISHKKASFFILLQSPQAHLLFSKIFLPNKLQSFVSM